MWVVSDEADSDVSDEFGSNGDRNVEYHHKSKDWLKPAPSLLNTLEDVKPTVYNFTLTDAKSLKCKHKTHSERLRAVPENTKWTSTVSNPLGNRTAWGSSGSIPDLLQRQTTQKRPESAKTNRDANPINGLRQRPQSAKPILKYTKESPTSNQGLGISIFGSKCGARGHSSKGQRPQIIGVGQMSGKKQDRCKKNVLTSEGNVCQSNKSTADNTQDDNGLSYLEETNKIVKFSEPIHLNLPTMEVECLEDNCLSTERLIERACDSVKKENFVNGSALDGFLGSEDEGFTTNNMIGTSSSRCHISLQKMKRQNSEEIKQHKHQTHFVEKENMNVDTVPRKLLPVKINSGTENESNDWIRSMKLNTRQSDPRILTPVSLVTLNYGIDEGITTNDDVETTMAQLSILTDRSQTNNNNVSEIGKTCVISNPEKNYYELARCPLKPEAVSESQDQIVMTTKTVQLNNEYADLTEVKVQSVILSAPTKQFTCNPSYVDQLKRTPGRVTKKPKDVPCLNLENLIDSCNVSKATKTHHHQKYPERPKSQTNCFVGQPVLLRRPRTKSAHVGKHLRRSFHLNSKVRREPLPRRRPSSSLFDPNADEGDRLDEWNEINCTGEAPQAFNNQDLAETMENQDRSLHFSSGTIETRSPKTTAPLSPVQSPQPVSMKTIISPSSANTTPPFHVEVETSFTESKIKNQARHSALRKLPHKKENVKNHFKQSNFSSLLEGHYSSYSRSPSAPVEKKVNNTDGKKTVVKSALVTKEFHPDKVDFETEEILECRKLQERLRQSGININIHTLKRALLPPDGSTYHYRETTTGLPKSQSIGLLSHPRYWLPAEYRKLQQAKKLLARANEQSRLRKQEEEKTRKKSESTQNVAKKTYHGKSGKKVKVKRSQCVM